MATNSFASTEEIKRSFMDYVDQIQMPIQRISEHSKHIINKCSTVDALVGHSWCKDPNGNLQKMMDEGTKLAKLTHNKYNQIKKLEISKPEDQEYKNLVLKELYDSNMMWTVDTQCTQYAADGRYLPNTVKNILSLIYGWEEAAKVQNSGFAMIYVTLQNAVLIPTAIIGSPFINDLPEVISYSVLNKEYFNKQNSVVVPKSKEAAFYQLTAENKIYDGSYFGQTCPVQVENNPTMNVFAGEDLSDEVYGCYHVLDTEHAGDLFRIWGMSVDKNKKSIKYVISSSDNAEEFKQNVTTANHARDYNIPLCIEKSSRLLTLRKKN